jgi:hypothetical protein
MTLEATSAVIVTVSVAALPRVVLPVIDTSAAVKVPVNVGDALFDFVAIAVAMLSNSVLISVPLTILAGLPEGNESFVAKFVVLV